MAAGLDFDTPAESKEQTGLDFVQVFRRRKFLLFLGLAVGAGLAYLQSLKQVSVYKSTARVMVTHHMPNIPLDMGAQVVSRNTMQNELILIRSPTILQRAVEEGELEKLPSLGRGAAAKIASGLEVKQITGTDILEVTYTGARPLDAQRVVEAITKRYVEFLGENEKASTDEVIKIITDARQNLLQELEREEAEYDEFRKKAQLIFELGDGVNPHASRLSQIESQRTTIIIERSQIAAELKALSEARARGGNDAAIRLLVDKLSEQPKESIDPATQQFASTTSQLFQLSLEKELLLADVGPNHPRVREMEKKIELTKNYLMKTQQAEPGAMLGGAEPLDLVSAYLNRLKLQLKTNAEKEAELTQLFEKEQKLAAALENDEAENARRLASIRRKQQLFDTLVQRLQETSLVEEVEGRTAEIISPASMGSESRPDTAKIMTTGCVLGLLAGFALACLVELADKSFRSADDLMATLAVPILSHVPYMKEATKKAKGQSGPAQALVTIAKPKSRSAEAFRSVRTAIYFSTSGEVHKVIQVTSPVAGDGKSTLSGNLAVSIANSGKKTLLIDADLRRPTVHKVFGLENKVGLSAVVALGTPIDEAVQPTEVENLSILTCGRRPENPSELLLSPEFDQLISHLRATYDFVIIDTPPVLAVTDPASVAARADGVIMALRLSKRSRTLAKRAVEQLQTVGANILGVVVNGVESVDAYGYQSYAYGNYGYGYGGYGNYGGYYQRPDAEMLALWDVAVTETRALIAEGWD